MGAVYLSHAVISVGLKTGEGILKTGKTLTSTTIHGASDAVRMQKTSIYTDYGGENVSNGIAKNAGATLAQVTLGSERIANAAGNSVLYGYTKLARPGIQRWSAETRNKIDWAISKNTPFSNTFNVRSRERAAIYARKQRTNRKKLEKYNKKRISLANTRRGAVRVASKSMNQQYRNLTSAVMGGSDITSKTGRLYAHGSRYAIRKTGKTAWKLGKGMWRSWKNRRALFKGAQRGLAALLKGLSSAVAAVGTVAVAASPVMMIATLVISVTSVLTIFTSFFTTVVVGGCTTGTEIPVCDKGNSTKALAYASQAWDPTSDQYEFWNCPNGGCSAFTNPSEGKTKYGDLKVDETGYYYYDFNGTRYYCVALASYYTNHIGDRFSITTDRGKTYYVIVCDQKADVHTHAGNNADSENCLSGDNDMVEFYVQRKVMANIEDWPNNIDDERHPFAGTVTRMIKMSGNAGCASSIDGPLIASNGYAEVFEGSDPKLPHSPGNPFAPYWCTWWAWNRFYDVYGYDSGARSNGCDNADEIVRAHPDKWEKVDKPVAGGVFSVQPGAGILSSGAASVAGHVGFIEKVDGNYIWTSEGGYLDQWHVGLVQYTLDGFYTTYGGKGSITFVAPK